MTAWKGSQRQGLPATLASFCSASLPWNSPRYTLTAPCNKQCHRALLSRHTILTWGLATACDGIGLVQEWNYVLSQDDLYWDQNAFNDLFRRDMDVHLKRPDRLFK